MKDRMGLRIVGHRFSKAGELTLRILARFSPAVRERLLFFNSSSACLAVQKAIQRCLGGPRSLMVEFTEGHLSACRFECLTSEKYFMVGPGFESKLQATLHKELGPSEIVYDVGANAGYWSLLFSRLSPSGRVFAFEASPINFQRLKRNIELNRAEQITFFNLAVMDRAGSVLLVERGSESCIVPSPGSDSEAYVTVRAVCLDDFVFNGSYPPPTFLKIDVEGAAGCVLAGMQRTLQNARPRLICELHQEAETSTVLKILTEHSYRAGVIGSENRFPKHILATPC